MPKTANSFLFAALKKTAVKRPFKIYIARPWLRANLTGKANNTLFCLSKVFAAKSGHF